MVLVDTSIWILMSPRNGLRLEDYVDFEEVVTCMPVVQEFLQGIGSERAYRVAREAMLALPILEDPMPQDLFVEAASIYRQGRKSGFTIRSAYDCLIAACAIRNAVPLLHCDRDYDNIARYTAVEARNLYCR